jgi:hypothetical protein
MAADLGNTEQLAMADLPKMLYCRGCNTESEEQYFDGYKQCNMCREKSFTRKRRQVTCECGRTLLACSLKIHLRSIFHADHTRPLPLVQQPTLIKKPTVLPAQPGIKKKKLSPAQQGTKAAADLPRKQLAAKEVPGKQTPAKLPIPAKQMPAKHVLAKPAPAKQVPIATPRPSVKATGNGALVFMTNMR